MVCILFNAWTNNCVSLVSSALFSHEFCLSVCPSRRHRPIYIVSKRLNVGERDHHSLTRNQKPRRPDVPYWVVLPERDYVIFGPLLSQIRLSSVTFMRPINGVKTFGNIFSLFCTLAVLWSPCKILRRSSQGYPSALGVKRKRGSKI